MYKKKRTNKQEKTNTNVKKNIHVFKKKRTKKNNNCQLSQLMSTLGQDKTVSPNFLCIFRPSIKQPPVLSKQLWIFP